ncbi:MULTISPECIES: DUF402 domain-containing protein [Pyrobaculum]|uniref:Probable ribonuclease FAU-1 n=3 Tax=Pyrobaculum TaxID=2276 RepID=FAU1_PYRAR|nr:DUF402 domain-containing protein [Pyrobaculum arsenaticum]A4WJU1.1 RecName: Full=Probable ribonuclease FAU-1; AltName: Full=RNA-binding protein FAU-1 [Pyrobaculum arsenaticum DSM 13514]ABP50658.1 RNA-binding protein AU-1 [Pyrobaculum arsenaticum DSM 13514]MCY0889587.1 DUF402 domain-containing protein [Pyrobaculum arsenaticum]NYR14409.1 DUF402 domain-containing protein [Pyrobaculum arsenaticum]
MYRARIRGIYATALTKLALDWGFKVVQPTEKIARRFGLEPDFSPPDITVKDHESKTGIVAMGLCEAVEAFLSKLTEYADPIVARARARLKEVFVGRAVGEATVEGPGGEVFDVPRRYVLTPGATGIYTVVRPPIGPLKGVAAPEIVVEGQYVELNTTGRVSYSEHIPAEEAVRLRILAETRLRQYASIGLRFKSSARYAPDDAIAAEAEALYKEMLEISKGGSPGQVLRRGKCFAVVLFDSASKARLDEARAAVVPTVRGHHALRAQGLGKCLDLLDHVGGDVYEKAAEFLAGEAAAVYHVKPWGEVVKMRAEPVGVRGGVLVLRRRLRPGGVLDGIGVKIERGFYALTCVPRGKGYVVHTYYTAEGKAVGTYVNANTVPEWGRRVIYIDLLVDKAFDGGGERVLDLDEYEKYAEMFPQRLRDPLSRLPKTPIWCTEEGIKTVA